MPNEYVNKVEFGNETVMDITDTTAETSDVLEGEVFYAKSGARSVGTLGDATQSTHGLMSSTDKTKLDSLATVASTGSYNDLLNKPDLSQYITTVPTMVGATSSENGTSGLVPAPTTGDVNKFLAGDGTYKSGGLPMVILSYGHSTWAEFEEAYNHNVIVYTRASSGSNPASGSQTRMAFMAYVNNATTPTEVEFQYYRSVNSHSSTQMGDQVFVYKLNKTGGWSVTTREASIKQIKAGTSGNLSVSWSGNVVTIDNDPAITYTLAQDSNNGHTLLFTGTDGTNTSITIPDNNTTYEAITSAQIDALFTE